MASLFSKPKAPVIPDPPAVPTRDETQIGIDQANILRRRLGRNANILTRRRLGGLTSVGGGSGIGGGSTAGGSGGGSGSSGGSNPAGGAGGLGGGRGTNSAF